MVGNARGQTNWRGRCRAVVIAYPIAHPIALKSARKLPLDHRIGTNSIDRMASISSVSTQSLLAQQQLASSAASAAAQQSALTSNAGTASQAASSTKVTLGQSTAAPTYTVAAVTPTPVWEHSANDLISMRMGGNMSGSTLSARFGGLGAALLGQVASTGSDFSQSVIQVPEGESVDGVTSASFHAPSANEIQLTVTTRSGATVDIKLGSDGDRLNVQMSVKDGELTESERDALGKLSESFQKSIDGLTATPPRLDLTGLTQYDTTALSSVRLQATVSLGNNQTQTLDFQASDTKRSVAFAGPAGAVDVSVDMTKPVTFGTPAQQAKAVSKYLQQFDDAKSRGQGDAALMSMFKDAFSALHSQYNTTTTQQSRFTLSAGDHGMLTGLADFSASIKQTATYPNPIRGQEADTFNYQVSQSTQLQGRGQADRGVKQQQSSSLDASYHRALSADTPLNLTESKYSQNYYYEQIHDKASSETEIAYRKGNLVKATLTQSAEQSQHTQKYVMGQLEEDFTTPTSKSRTVDVLSLVKAAERTDAKGIARNKEEQERVLASMQDKVMLEPNAARIVG